MDDMQGLTKLPCHENCQTPRMAIEWVVGWAHSDEGSTPCAELFETPRGIIYIHREMEAFPPVWMIERPGHRPLELTKLEFLAYLARELCLAFRVERNIDEEDTRRTSEQGCEAALT